MKMLLKFTGIYTFLSVLEAILMFVSGFDFNFTNRAGDGYQLVYFLLQLVVTVLSLLATVPRSS